MTRNMFKMLHLCNKRIVLSLFHHRQLTTFKITKQLNELKKDGVFCRNFQTIYKKQEIISLNTIDSLNNQIILNIKNRNKVYLKDVTGVLSLVESMNSINSQQGLLLLSCCTQLLTEQTPKERMQLAFRCWDILRSRMNLNVNHYNAMLQCYIDNGEDITISKFLDAMIPKPNANTYKLLLKAVCKLGYMNQATELISNMKAQNLKFDEDITNLLIEGYGKEKNMDMIQQMKEEIYSKNLMSSEIIVALLKTYFWNNYIEDALKMLKSCHEKNKNFFTEQQVFEVLESALEYNRDDIFNSILKLLPESTLNNSVISPYMQSMCTIFVYKGYPKMAHKVYQVLPAPVLTELNDESVYARAFIRECIKAGSSSVDILHICKDLVNSNKNKYAYFVACEAALHFYKEEIAIQLLNVLKKQNHAIRTHYFWPLLIRSYKEKGEKGLFNILAIMNEMEVLIDEETIADYLLPNILKFQCPSDCVKQLQSHGVPIASSALPILTVLLKGNHLKEANDFCSNYKAKIKSLRLVNPLLNSFFITKNTPYLLNILKFIHNNDTESKVKFLGNFLINFLIKMSDDIESFEIILQDCLTNNYKISQIHLDMCTQRLSKIISDTQHLERINGMLTAITIQDTFLSSGDNDENNLSFSQLLAHLNELEAKQMNTRGVLRKLLLASLQSSDYTHTSRIIKKIEHEKIELSDGMKATLMDFYVKRNDLKCAEKYMNLLLQNPKFMIDGHKMLDFITILAKNGKIEDVVHFLSKKYENCSLNSSKSLIPNALNLLNAVSSHGSLKYTEDVFDLLITYKYCNISNVLLGPFMKIYFERDDIEGAYNMFVKLNKKYRKTPLKHELLTKLIQKVYTDDQNNINNSNPTNNDIYFDMIENVRCIIANTHGGLNSQMSIILALADLGYEKKLINYINSLSMALREEVLIKECHRLADQNKSDTLITLAKSIKKCDDLQHINIVKLFELAMNVYRNKNDHQSALNLWNYLDQNKINPSKKMQQTLLSVYNANNISVPSEIFENSVNG